MVHVHADAALVAVGHERDVDAGPRRRDAGVDAGELRAPEVDGEREARHVAREEVDVLEHRGEQLDGQLVDDAGDLLGVVQRRLGTPGLDTRTDLVHPHARVGLACRELHAKQGDSVPAARVAGLAQADRQRHAQVVDLHAMAGVVLAQATQDGGDEGVVERAAIGLGGALEAAEGDVHDVEPPLGLAADHDGGEPAVDRANQLDDRHHLVDRVLGCLHGVGHRVFDGRDRLLGQATGESEDVQKFLGHAARQQAGFADLLAFRRGRDVGLGRRGGLPRHVHDPERQLESPDSVGHGVVNLADECGAPAFDAFDHGELPQGPVLVEGLHAHRAGHDQHVLDAPRRRGADAPEVVGQVEMRVVDPPRITEPERRVHNVLAEARNLAAGDVDLALDDLPVGGALVEADGDDGRAQERVLLHAPGQRVRLGHELRQEAFLRPLKHGKSLRLRRGP